MSTEVVLSKTQTDRDANPRVPSGITKAGQIRHRIETCLVSVADVASTYNFFSLPARAVVHSMQVSTSADMGSTTTVIIGLNRTTVDGGAVVDADFFSGAGLDLASGAIQKSEVVFLNVITVANAKLRLWEHLALTTDPGYDYDVVMTTDGACNGAGTVEIEVEYSLM